MCAFIVRVVESSHDHRDSCPNARQENPAERSYWREGTKERSNAFSGSYNMLRKEIGWTDGRTVRMSLGSQSFVSRDAPSRDMTSHRHVIILKGVVGLMQDGPKTCKNSSP